MSPSGPHLSIQCLCHQAKPASTPGTHAARPKGPPTAREGSQSHVLLIKSTLSFQNKMYTYDGPMVCDTACVFMSIKLILQRGRCVIPKSCVYESTSPLQRTEVAEIRVTSQSPTHRHDDMVSIRCFWGWGGGPVSVATHA